MKTSERATYTLKMASYTETWSLTANEAAAVRFSSAGIWAFKCQLSPSCMQTLIQNKLHPNTILQMHRSSLHPELHGTLVKKYNNQSLPLCQDDYGLKQTVLQHRHSAK